MSVYTQLQKINIGANIHILVNLILFILNALGYIPVSNLDALMPWRSGADVGDDKISPVGIAALADDDDD